MWHFAFQVSVYLFVPKGRFDLQLKQTDYDTDNRQISKSTPLLHHI